MNSRILIWVSFAFLIVSCKEDVKTGATNEAANDVVKAVVSEVLYEDLEGNEVVIDSFKGKKLVLNYWATWCKPCIEEMPAMARAQELLKDDNVVFLFASDQSLEKIITFRDKRQFGLDFIKFNGAYADLEITALPVTLIYNEAGEQVERFEGGKIWDADEMIAMLKEL